MSTESITFEQSLQRLDEIVRRMEKGDVPLEEALSLFEEGTRLAGSCSRLLDEAGLRGKRRGPVYFTELHANFLAHDPARGVQSDAKGAFAAAAELVAEAREAVARRAGINLDMEIKVWPCPLY